jgi:hypothetical protein
LTTSAAPVELRPGLPRAYAALLASATVAALVAIAISGLPPVLRLALAPLPVVLAWRAWARQHAFTGAVLRIDGEGRAEWRGPSDHGPVSGRLVAHWQAGPVAALVLAAAGAGSPRARIAIWRDQVDADAWRRLSILLRHQRHGQGAIG